jgi:hypothetical protein
MAKITRRNGNYLNLCACGELKSAKAKSCIKCYTNPEDSPTACVCGAKKSAELSLCADCVARLNDIRTKRNIERVMQFQNCSATDFGESVPRIVERMIHLPSRAYVRTNRDMYDSDAGNAFDDLVRLYEDTQ